MGVSTRRRFFATEVIQSSGMDCGPAALKSLLEGHGIRASYGRLREACQTDVDGTSIDMLEEAAVQLGLTAAQVMLPLDHLLLAESKALPAIVVTRQPTGSTHFVVLWRKHGPWVQVMDPAIGRRWIRIASFLDEVFLHTQRVDAQAWREWASAPEGMLGPLKHRIRALGLSPDEPIRLALEDSGWAKLAALDAAIRLLATLGWRNASPRLLANLVRQPENIPDPYWSVRKAPDSEDEINLAGCVLVSVTGVQPRAAAMSPELGAALTDQDERPGRELLKLVHEDGLAAPAALVAALCAAAAGTALEALLLRGVMDLARFLGSSGQRIAAITALIVFAALLTLLEVPLFSGLLRAGRRLESRLRLKFLNGIPLLSDRYFQSRLISDMAERSHSVERLRQLPELAGRFVQVIAALILTTLGIIWLNPASWPFALAAAVVAATLPLIAQPILTERDLRARAHLGAMSRFYYDALRGLVPIRAHGAERALRTEYNDLLKEWAVASLCLQRAAVLFDGLQAFSGYGLTIALVLHRIAQGGEPASLLLLIYWALQIPILGQEAGQLATRYPNLRNTTLRLMEPLEAISSATREDPVFEPAAGPAGIRFNSVTVVAAGHTILENVSVEIPPGAHVAIVGASGAGKSSFAGVLLGWHRPSAGEVFIDGALLNEEALRRQTAWVDPQVQLWNRSLFDNLRYGAGPAPEQRLGRVLEAADLTGLLGRMPDGFETSLGEGGALVSGGEGQRVRAGRAMLRENPRLVILDEASRGLDHGRRREIVRQARELWRDVTLISITHDIADTLAFDRVLVIDHGQIVEDGSPAELRENAESQYRGLLEADREVRENLWRSADWRRMRMSDGKVEAAE